MQIEYFDSTLLIVSLDELKILYFIMSVVEEWELINLAK
jgi:hypothetical protein